MANGQQDVFVLDQTAETIVVDRSKFGVRKLLKASSPKQNFKQMKNSLLLIFLNVQPGTGYQEGSGFTLADGMYIPDVFIRTIIVILLFYVVTSFLLTLIRMLLNHRLKSRMIGMGMNSEEAAQMLKIGAENRNYAVKWFLLLLSAGIGFAVISSFPFGWCSVALMAFSLSLGFGAYYVYLKKRKDGND